MEPWQKSVNSHLWSCPHQSLPGRPARLVFLLQDLKFGGTQRQALQLARLLDPARFQVEVWLLAAGDELAPLARDWGLPLVRLGRQEHVGPGGPGPPVAAAAAAAR